VSSRNRPGLPHFGQSRSAACWRALRRQSRHKIVSFDRTGYPQVTHAREQVMHLPPSTCRILCLPQAGQVAFAASSVNGVTSAARTGSSAAGR
jgi:hypothetical protein